MATYIKGVTDVLPGSVAMAPDYKLLSTALSTLQAKYDKGFDQVKSMYDSLINQPLSSSDNEKFRQDYLKKADAELSRFAGIDLGNPNNVSQAMNVFKPLVNDKQYVKDLFLTKAQGTEIEKMESVKNNTDAKIRAGYNSTMEKWLNIGRKRLSEMKRDDGSIDAATYNKFSPWESPIDYAMAKAAEQKLEYKRTDIEGMYFKYITNGEEAVGPFKNWFSEVIGDRFDNQFRIEGDVRYEEKLQGMMAQDPTLDRKTATQKLAQDFSGTYVKLANDQINQYQSKISSIDNSINALKRKYPSGVPKNQVDQIKLALKQKDALEDGLKKLKVEKGTDQQFQQKAVGLFMNNPAGTYVNKIKDEYAQGFGEIWASKSDVDYKPNQVALQKDQQAFDSAQQLKRFAHDKEMKQMGIDADRALKYEELMLKGDLVNQTTGASYGTPIDAGKFSIDYLYRQEQVNNFDKTLGAYVDDRVLASAANLDYKNGVAIIGANSGFDLGVVKKAITAKANGKALDANSIQHLTRYLNSIKSGIAYDDKKHTFNFIRSVIDKGILDHRGNNPNLAAVALPIVTDAGTARVNYNARFNEEQKHLSDIYAAGNIEVNPYISLSSNGVYSINYDALNKVTDASEKGALLQKLIPLTSYKRLSAQSAIQTRPIELHPANPDKLDPSVTRNVLENYESMGYTDDKGKFVKFKEEEIASIREKAQGDTNLKKLFDTGLRYIPTIIDNKPYVRVVIPTKVETAGGKAMSSASLMGIDPNGEISKRNHLEVLVPIEKVGNIAGSDYILVNPLTKQKTVLKNDLRTFLAESMRDLKMADPLSWVSTNGLTSQTGVSAFDPSLNNRIAGGQVSHDDNNNININFFQQDGTAYHLNYTSEYGVSYSDFLNDQSRYDKEIRLFVENAANNYAVTNIETAKKKETERKLRTDLVPWSSIYN